MNNPHNRRKVPQMLLALSSSITIVGHTMSGVDSQKHKSLSAKLLTLLFFMIVLAAPAWSAGFYGVHSPNGADVWAVGDSGRVYHSVDGGANWGSSPLGVQTFRSVFTMSTSIWMVGDGGAYYRSTNAGGSWTPQTLNGGTRLNAITFASPTKGWAVGNGGSVVATTNGGSNWSSQTSGIVQALYGLSFLDTLTGYACGAAGKLLKTTNSGTTWSSTGDVVWTKNILSVSASGQTVYVTGTDGFCSKSTNGGTTWNSLNFKTDSNVDVDDVFVLSPTNAYFIGGGGFIRNSVDGGTTYSYGMHQMHAKLNDVFFYTTSNGWACSEKNNAVIRTTDAGATWQLPQGTTVNYQWINKVPSISSIGNTFVIDPFNKNRIFMAGGNVIYVSIDRGETWSTAAGKSAGGGSQWSLLISPADSNIWLAATSGSPKGVKRSTNAGVTWTSVLARNFTSYGMPLEIDPDSPENVIFAAEGTGSGPDGVLYHSRDFGATWDTLAQTSFRSPCDIAIVPGNSSLWYVGDGTTGTGNAQMCRSTDYGTSWTSIYSSTSSEIPMIAVSRLRNTYSFATAWSSTSVTKSTNSGLTWTSIAPTGSSWGTDIAKDDPNVVMYGVYGGGTSYLSTNAGVSFSSSSLSGSNSGMLCYDRATFLVHQTGAIWKYSITYSVPLSSVQAVTVLSPNGGENWAYNSNHNITWTASNFTNVKIDYKTSPGGAWQTIITSTPSSAGSYSWLVPNVSTSQARVRVSDASDTNPLDSTDGVFSISVSNITSSPSSKNFGSVGMGTSKSDTIRIYNTGTATLVVSSVTTGSNFAAGRTSFSIPSGSSDTLSVQFSPSALSSYQDTLRLNNNSPAAVFKVPLSGIGVAAISSLMKITLRDSGGELDSLEYGTGVSATDGIDPAFGEYELPPLPPTGVMDVRWQIAGTLGTERDIRDTLGGAHQQIIYTGKLQAGEGYPFVLKWNHLDLPAGTFTLRDGPAGAFFLVNMKLQDSLVITDDQIPQFQIVYDAGNAVSSTAQAGWNILSVPVTVADLRKTVLFPAATSSAFAYTAAGYVNRDTLGYGIGYWLKFPSTQPLSLSGGVITTDTIDVIEGWNIIGSISTQVPVGNIIQIPGGIVVSSYFGYGITGYGSATSIDPMRGYWVKVSQNGKLVLPGSTARPHKKSNVH